MRIDNLKSAGPLTGAIFADSHGNQSVMERVIAKGNVFNFIVHLGDGLSDGMSVARNAGIPFFGVAGNWDNTTTFPKTRLLKIESFSFLLTHGDLINIYHFAVEEERAEHLRLLEDMAIKANAQALFFGHSHYPDLFDMNERIFCNPGNHLLGATTCPTYGLLSVDRDRGFSVSILRENEEGEWIVEKELIHEQVAKKI